MPTSANKVKFTYITTGSSLPVTPDSDTIYFLESAKEIYVGSTLIANYGAADLSDYKVKDVTISGTGTVIVSANFDASTGMLTLTKGNATLAKGADTSGTATTLSLGGTFTVMTDTSVSGNAISDENTTFTLPDAVTNAQLGAGSAAGKVKLTVTASNLAQPREDEVTVYTAGSVASGNTGLVTGDDVYQAIDAATAGLTGAMHLLGESSTAVTDGGTEAPTIGGTTVPIADLHAGDVVLYSGSEFVWLGAVWEELGSESSYALKTTTVTGANGLTGGGTLTGNVTISHGSAPSSGSGATASAGATPTDLVAVTGVTVDTYGHVAGVTTGDFATKIGNTIDAKINLLDVAAPASGDYVATISETDGKISATMGTKGYVASGDTSLVDGGTVYTAIDAATTKWTVV